MWRAAALISCLGALAPGFVVQNPSRDTSQPFRQTATTIRGRVRIAGSDIPVRKARITLAPDAGAPVDSIYADNDGRFTFANVSSGRYVISAWKSGFVESRFGARSFWDRHVSIVATAGQPTDEVVLTLEKGAAISGRGVYRARIDDDFSFQYVGLFGPLLIRPAGGAMWMLKSVRAGGVDITDTPTMFGTRGQSLTDVEVILTNRGPAVSGNVTDARGRAVESCTAIAFAADRARWGRQSRYVKTAPCAADGTFSIPGLPAAEYLIAAVDRIQSVNGAGEWQDPEVLAVLAVDAARVTLTDGQTATVAAKLVVRSEP